MTRPGTLIAFAVLTLAACRSTMDLPSGYVTIPPEDGAESSAVSPAGNRIVVRRHENPPEGTLEFWRDADKAELVDGKGYDVVKSGLVRSAEGDDFWEFLFEIRRTEGEYLYLVLIHVDGSHVIVTEAGGRAEAMETDLAALQEVLR